LTVFNFAQSATVLSLYTHGVISLLGKSCFIDMKGAFSRIANQFTDLFLNSVDRNPLIPWRMSYKMLQRLIRTLSNVLRESAAIASISI
jgi:hypothetical protein